mmetsp:Transcript_27893/g.55918  ORF Transcript_27893/g.55918 Transcript_27893/m.55918 type:complete len:327 (+) Transcript_27893:19-999(+)
MGLHSWLHATNAVWGLPLTSLAFLLFISPHPALSFVPTCTVRPPLLGTDAAVFTASSTALSSDTSQDYSPSDYDPTDVAEHPPGQHAPLAVDEVVADESIRMDLKREIMMLASVTDRGNYASVEERDILIELIVQLEALNPSPNPASGCAGEWDLALSSVQPYRSSPFFLAVREVLGPSTPKKARAAETGFSIHDLATSVGRIGRVRQTISQGEASGCLEMVSEVDLEVGVLPGLPVQAKGTVVTTATLDVVGAEGWTCLVKETRIKDSNVPFLDSLLNDGSVPVSSIYEQLRGGVPKATLKTFYLDDLLRITRDVDDNFFVWVRA